MTAQQRNAEMVEDIEFMISTHESADIIASRIGKTPRALQRFLQRQGRLDLTASLGAERMGRLPAGRVVDALMHDGSDPFRRVFEWDRISKPEQSSFAPWVRNPSNTKMVTT